MRYKPGNPLSDPTAPGGGSENPEFVFAVRQPSPVLARYVRDISAYAEHVGSIAAQEQPPTASIVPMILVLGPGWDYAIAQDEVALNKSFVAGLFETPVTMQSRGYAVCMQVNFSLLGARRFLGVDMHELASEIAPLEDVVGNLCGDMEARLQAINGWPERFEYLESVLIDRLLGKHKSRQLNTAPVEQALAEIEQSKSTASVSELAKNAGVSRKHLVTLFAREVGMSPKQYVQLRRFEQVLDAMQGNTEQSLADFALACGYADQSHFTRQFRRYMGRSPTDYLKGRRSSPEE